MNYYNDNIEMTHFTIGYSLNKNLPGRKWYGFGKALVSADNKQEAIDSVFNNVCYRDFPNTSIADWSFEVYVRS